jgi:hypothetical protein
MAFPINKPNKSHVSETLVGATLKLIIILHTPMSKEECQERRGQGFLVLNRAGEKST